MANRERGELALIAGGRTYTLRLTTHGCCALPEFAGRTWDQVLAGLHSRGAMRDARLVCWVALRDHHPEIARDEADCLKAIGALIDEAGGLGVIQERLRTLVQLNAAGRADLVGAVAEVRTPGGTPRTDWRQLYVDALTIGLTPDRFWALSLRELWNERRAHVARARDRADRDVALAWQIEALARTKQLPALKSLLTRGRQTQTRDEQRRSLLQLSALYKIPVRTRAA